MKQLALPLCFLMAGCSTTAPAIVYKDRIVEVATPTPAHIDPTLMEDCAPSVDIPATGPVQLQLVLDRLGSVEDALTLCRANAAKLRTISK